MNVTRLISRSFARMALLGLAGGLFCIAGSAAGTDSAGSKTAEARPLSPELVSEVDAVTPGKPFYVALKLNHPEGYHTYWEYPGVVGVPTSIKWKLPAGWKSEPMHWPGPIRVDMLAIKAHGYHGLTYLPMRLTPPAEIDADEITLAGDAVWMCCGKTCHPGFGEVSVTLPVRANSSLTADAPAIEKSLREEPTACPDWTTSAVLKDGVVTLRLARASDEAVEDPGDVFFFTRDGMIDSDSEQEISRLPDGGLEIRMKTWQFSPEDSSTLPGVLQAGKGWSKRFPDRKYMAVSCDLRREP